MLDNDLVQQLMIFRTSYLRGVARAAVDLEFRKSLTANPLQVLKDTFGYECPWQLDLVLLDDPSMGPRVNPANGTVMTLPYFGESITVYIPKKPQDSSPERQMDALAAYYHENPWFLHQKRLTGDAVIQPADLKAAREIPVPPPIDQGKWASVATDPAPNARYDLGVNFDLFISLAAALFNAVALAWENELFLKDLTGYRGQPDEPRKTTINLMYEWLGYSYPFELDLIVQEDPTATYNPAAGKWENTTAPVLLLSIPWMTGAVGPDAAMRETEANRLHPSVAVTGLTLYNTNGSGYPFTCG